MKKNTRIGEFIDDLLIVINDNVQQGLCRTKIPLLLSLKDIAFTFNI